MEWLLFFSLFFPRISLFFAWMVGGIPYNNVPLFFDVVSAIVFPRMLIIYYIWYAELGTGWMIAHIIALIVSKVFHALGEND